MPLMSAASKKGMAPGSDPGLTGRLKEAIRASGQSLNRLGRAAGIGRDRLSRFLRGERDLVGAALDRLCAALGLELCRRTRPAGPRDTPAAAEGGEVEKS